MFVRRRPLLRAAAVGGGAYVAGKRSARRQMAMDQDSMSQAPESGQGMSQAPASSAPSVSDQLAQLSSLHQQGSLSDTEFAAAKARLLSG